ncbi:MAG: TrbI/VirB10 family protein [Acidobacteria bacterium]|nr:TrbI/VirB10 family protein [Acidobacteriota bacterium]MCI0717731.1 TrbI/VirB10 family protein [Acidobacteriota bacterium]
MAVETEKVEQIEATGEVAEEALEPDKSRAGRIRLREIFRQAFDKARREQQPMANRRELGRDRSRSLFLLMGAAVAILLLFLGVYSSPNKEKRPEEARRVGTPNLGRKVTPGQEAAQSGSVTPLLSADTASNVPPLSQDVTPDDISKTARLPQPSQEIKPKVKNPDQYALGRIDFSDPALEQQPGYGTPPPQPPTANSSSNRSEGEELRKPSLVFVRAALSNASGNPPPPVATFMANQDRFASLPVGTRLVARLLAPVSTAVSAPVVAAIEYNYERDGEILVPAGARAVGTLQQADRSGDVAVHFDTLQMPDGSTEKIDATGMGLDYGPIRGRVDGKRTGTRFLVRALSGIGTVATYLVGAGGNGLNGPLSESALLRDRIATNIGMAADQELNRLAFNQNIVVTVPGNTRFYVVFQKAAGGSGGESRTASAAARDSGTARLPSIEELRELMQLKRELSEMVRQSNAQNQAQQSPQQ